MRLTQATLIRLNRDRAAGAVARASVVESSPDGLTWTLKLETRGGLLGWRAVHFGRRVSSPSRRSTTSRWRARSPRAADRRQAPSGSRYRRHHHRAVHARAVRTGAEPAGFDSDSAAPQARGGVEAGTFREAWGLRRRPSELAGLGPFVLKAYVHGERMVFARNPHYWRLDEGRVLPCLDEPELQIVPDQNAELLRLKGGTTDLMTAQVRPEDLAGLRGSKRAAPCSSCRPAST